MSNIAEWFKFVLPLTIANAMLGIAQLTKLIAIIVTTAITNKLVSGGRPLQICHLRFYSG
jgi:hypothetical protein